MPTTHNVAATQMSAEGSILNAAVLEAAMGTPGDNQASGHHFMSIPFGCSTKVLVTMVTFFADRRPGYDWPGKRTQAEQSEATKPDLVQE